MALTVPWSRVSSVAVRESNFLLVHRGDSRMARVTLTRCIACCPRLKAAGSGPLAASVAGELGSMQVLVEHDRTGLHPRSGGAEDLAGQTPWIGDHAADPARPGVEARFNTEGNYDQPMAVCR